jgi:hypothetical protein
MTGERLRAEMTQGEYVRWASWHAWKQSREELAMKRKK